MDALHDEGLETLAAAFGPAFDFFINDFLLLFFFDFLLLFFYEFLLPFF
jgi:hypothetical protein